MSLEGPHPDDQALQKFALGQLDSKTVEEISAHLETCDLCNHFLDQNFQDTFVERLSELTISSQDFVLPQEVPAPEISFERLQELFASNTKYEIEKPIGIGGMGAVYLANHKVMGRKVAIKLMKNTVLANPKSVKRFEIETKSAAQLSHPNIVAAYDADQIDGVHFLVMEFVDGESLAQVLKRKGALTVRKACNYVYQVANGLKHAHSHSMIHRDIKPQNLMRTKQGRIKILDFGLARLQASEMPDQNLTQSGVMMGTANFVAPEQARDGRNADIRSDLYSLGCTFYTLLTAKVPFPGGTYMEKILSHCTKPFPDVLETNPEVPQIVADVIKKLTDKDPDQRIQTPKELMEVLEPIVKADDFESSKEKLLAQVIAGNLSGGVTGQPQDRVYEEDPAEQIEFLEPELDQAEPLAQPVSNRKVDRRSALLLVSSLILAAFGAFWWFGTGQADSSGGAGQLQTSNDGIQPVPSRRPNDDARHVVMNGKGSKVLVMLNRRDFWYDDLQPLMQRLKENEIDVEIGGVEKGVATFDSQTTLANPQNQTIEVTVDEILAGDRLDQYSAIVFMGNSVQDFVGNAEVREKIQTLLNRSKGNRWIIGMGRGMSVPLFFRTFDSVSVCRSRWIQRRFTEGRTPIYEDRPVVVDRKNLAVTARDWKVADQCAQTLVKLLTTENADE